MSFEIFAGYRSPSGASPALQERTRAAAVQAQTYEAQALVQCSIPQSWLQMVAVVEAKMAELKAVEEASSATAEKARHGASAALGSGLSRRGARRLVCKEKPPLHRSEFDWPWKLRRRL
eukprot:Skav233951  [mRNA]  locus=scaffold1382:189393:190407:+ [translate_table: standard]